eukprot:9238744-Pyramimonas_sp.AAC.1
MSSLIMTLAAVHVSRPWAYARATTAPLTAHTPRHGWPFFPLASSRSPLYTRPYAPVSSTAPS